MRSGAHVSTLRDYLNVVRRRKWIIVLLTLLVPLVAVLLSARQGPVYEASAEVLLSQQDLGSALTATQDANVYTPADRRAQTQAALAREPSVALLALKHVRRAHLTPQELLDASSVSTKQNADLLTFTVRTGDPRLAAKLATAYAYAYTQHRLEVETRPLEAARKEVQARIDLLESQKGSLYETLVEKEQTLRTMEALKTSNATVERQAADADQVAPKPVRNAILGLVLGLFLGVGLAFLREALDTRVRSAEEIRERLELPLLARLPEPPRKLRADHRLAMLAEPTGVQAEAFRMLRTNLEFASLGKDMRTIMITSGVEQEGKSTTIANLAVALARAGRHVILVDLDLRRPFLARFFDLDGRPGLTQVAIGHADLDEALAPVGLSTPESLVASLSKGRARAQRKAHGNGNGSGAAPARQGRLEVLAAGPIPPDPGEFVGTERLSEILDGLRDRADIVLVDAPPLFHVGDGLALSAKVDGVVIVTRMDVVRRAMVSELKRLLEAMPSPKLGFVVTGAEAEEHYGGYGYGAYYYRPTERRLQKEALR
jgi:polysaccharide biosynthesis transport protein